MRDPPLPVALLLALAVTACDAKTSATGASTPTQPPSIDTPVVVAPMTTTSPTASPALASSPPPTDMPPPTPTTTRPSPTAAPTITPTVDPGCPRPPDDYRRVEVNGETLNARTLWMLRHAATLYDGPGDLLRVTQGSYTTDEATSFATHAGGGAVDLSIRNPANPAEILWDETDALVLALRRAGFAAWYRAPGDLGPGSPAHLHAIAIGDRELSPAAIKQLTGPSGYFRGFDGLPPEYGGPHPDPHGGPIVCPWMTEME